MTGSYRVGLLTLFYLIISLRSSARVDKHVKSVTECSLPPSDRYSEGWYPVVNISSNKLVGNFTGDKWLAFEKDPRTCEDKLIGMALANKIYPWQISELEHWANYLRTHPEQERIYFSMHCLKSPDLFKKFNVPYIYEVGQYCML